MTTGALQQKNNGKLSRREYNAFVKQLGIEDIRLQAAKIEALDCFWVPSSAEVKWRMSARYENIEHGFRSYHVYHANIVDKESKEATPKTKAKISVTFCVTYSSEILMDDNMFGKFKDINLTVNTWPYFREFIHSALLRMGWPPFIAPAFKT